MAPGCRGIVEEEEADAEDADFEEDGESSFIGRDSNHDVVKNDVEPEGDRKVLYSVRVLLCCCGCCCCCDEADLSGSSPVLGGGSCDGDESRTDDVLCEDIGDGEGGGGIYAV